MEPLEPRTLLALAAGFEQVKIARVDTWIATSMEFAPDGSNRLFVTDTSNRHVRVIKNGVLRSTPAITFSENEVDRSRERGMGSIAFDPSFASNKYVYLYYTRPDPAAPNTTPSNAFNWLVRYRMSASDPDVIDKSSALVLIDNLPSPSGVHNGGAIHFGADGMMYVTVGDGGAAPATAQDLNKYNGKVLRLNVAAIGAAANPAAMAPSSNPFYNAADGITVRDYVYAYGFRNPYTGAFKPGTNTLYINDVGAALWEEINDVQAGRNYGWPVVEGNGTSAGYVNPIHSYSHYPNGIDQPREGSSITGGVFYSGDQFPSEYQGKYFFADYLHQFIKVLDPATGRVSDFYTDADPDILDVLDLDVAPDGSLWTLSLGGTVRRYRYVGSSNRAPEASATASKASGTLPLVVNFSGAGSSDADGDRLTYSWNFGDGTTAIGRDVTRTYSTAGTYQAVLTASDGRGASDKSDPITIIAGSAAPTGAIITPITGTTYGGGDTISFSGAGADPEDGALPPSAFEWKVVFHHHDHWHTFIESIPGVTSGTFTIPRVGEQDPHQWYRIQLTVTDSHGVKHTSLRDVQPRTSTIWLTASAPGLQVTVDGTPQDTPHSFVSVEGMTRSVGVSAPQTTNGKTYSSLSWSDRGRQTHDIVTPADDTMHTATFRQTGGPMDVIVAARADAMVRDGDFADQNLGRDHYLVVKHSAARGNTRQTHIKFDMTGVDIAPGQPIKLRMYGRLSDAQDDSLPVVLYPVSDVHWGEDHITWNTRPALIDSELGTKTISGTVLTLYEWDVTSYLKNELAAGRLGMAFALKRGGRSDSDIWFNSAQTTANNPHLFIPAPPAVRPAAAGFVRGGIYSNHNFDNEPMLLTRLADSYRNVLESFLKFDLSDIGDFTSVKLRLHGALSAESAAGVEVGAYSSPETTWAGSTLSFNTRPGTHGPPMSTATIASTTPKWHEWNLTDFVRAEKAAGRGVITIALKATAPTDVWAAFDGDNALHNRPYLMIT